MGSRITMRVSNDSALRFETVAMSPSGTQGHLVIVPSLMQQCLLHKAAAQQDARAQGSVLRCAALRVKLLQRSKWVFLLHCCRTFPSREGKIRSGRRDVLKKLKKRSWGNSEILGSRWPTGLGREGLVGREGGPGRERRIGPGPGTCRAGPRARGRACSYINST